MAFLPVETEKSEGKKNTDISWPRKPVCEHSTSQVLDAQELIKITPDADGKEKKMRILHKSMRKVLDDVKSCCTTGYRTRMRHNLELNCFFNVGCYCCNISN